MKMLPTVYCFGIKILDGKAPKSEIGGDDEYQF